MDEGYFPRGRSILRQVHDEKLVGLFFGQRALTIGALHPVNYTGTAQTSSGRQRPFRRLVKTALDFESIFFASRAEADRTLAKGHKMHQKVRGTMPEAVGVFPAGTPYSAFQADLMLWTIAVMADSALYFYELFVRPLTPAERDAFWRDYVRFGELFGMPPECAPQSWPEFRAYFDGLLMSDKMALTEEAHYVGSIVSFEIPTPRWRAAQRHLHNLLIMGSLPARVRQLYGYGWSSAQALAFPLAVQLMRTARRLAPAPAMIGSNARPFEAVEAVERKRIERGQPTPGLPPLPPRAPAVAAEAPAEPAEAPAPAAA